MYPRNDMLLLFLRSHFARLDWLDRTLTTCLISYLLLDSGQVAFKSLGLEIVSLVYLYPSIYPQFHFVFFYVQIEATVGSRSRVCRIGVWSLWVLRMAFTAAWLVDSRYEFPVRGHFWPFLCCTQSVRQLSVLPVRSRQLNVYTFYCWCLWTIPSHCLIMSHVLQLWLDWNSVIIWSVEVLLVDCISSQNLIQLSLSSEWQFKLLVCYPVYYY